VSTAAGVGASTNGSRPLRIVMASANPDKVAEITAIVTSVAGDRIELVARPSDVGEVDETGDTLEENARLKAVALCAATGLPAIADDTGLEVDALGGAPGVMSARYSGEHATYADNVAKLVRELAAVEATAVEQRQARFRTVALVFFPDGTEMVAEGVVDGHIAVEARGSAGFGYDPVFVPDVSDADPPDDGRAGSGGGRTFAEMTPAEKHACSHRGRAFRALAVGLVRT
jgi:XTP/dITP diphosphohydrolase